MPNWGTLGTTTREFWDSFERAVRNVNNFANGDFSAPNGPAKCTPFTQQIAEDAKPGGVWAYYRDQAWISGGPHLYYDGVGGSYISGLWVTNRWGRLETGSGTGYYTSPVDNDVGTAFNLAIRRSMTQLLYPSAFYQLGWKHLAQLAETRPAAGTNVTSYDAVPARMVWAVDAAWWINMMLASTNTYPSWLADAIGKLAVPGWRTSNWVPQTDDLYKAIPELKSTLGWGVAGGWPYRVPFVQHPGMLNSSGLIKNAPPPDPSELERIQRWAMLRPWWEGVQAFGDVRELARAHTQDPRDVAGLKRACIQHSFFRVDGVGDFFETTSKIQRDATSRRSFDVLVDKILPAWLTLMQRLAYWQLVRAGVSSWSYYASGIDVAPSPTSYEFDWRPGFTADEMRMLRSRWESSKDDALIAQWFNAYLTTWLAGLQFAMGGSLGTSQLNAAASWYQLAKWRYTVPKVWEKGWEPPPLSTRMLDSYVKGNIALSNHRYGPMTRTTDIGTGLIEADNTIKWLANTAGIALTLEVAPLAVGVADFEARTDVPPLAQVVPEPPPVSPSAPAPTVPPPTVVATPTSQAFTLPELRRSASNTWAYVAAGTLAVVGIILATRKK